MTRTSAASSTVTATGEQSKVEPSPASADEASQLLQLAARLHSARGNPDAWREALVACRDWFGCAGILGLATDTPRLGPDELEALAGRLTHCATYGDNCGDCDPVKRRRCAALAPHLHEAAIATRKTLQAALFDRLPPTWIVDCGGRVREANAAAKALTRAGERFLEVDGCFAPVAPSGAALLRKALADGDVETRVSWKDRNGGEATLLLQVLPDSAGVALTLLPEPLGSAEFAPIIGAHLHLTGRQSELAANLLAGHTLADAARMMGISRDTANEHLVAILRRAKVPDRKSLLSLLRRVAHR
jgi:DNA-binding CsgD family transcriptional regulator